MCSLQKFLLRQIPLWYSTRTHKVSPKSHLERKNFDSIRNSRYIIILLCFVLVFLLLLSMHWEYTEYIKNAHKLRARAKFLFPALQKYKHVNNVSNTCMYITRMKVFSLALVVLFFFFRFVHDVISFLLNSLALLFELILDHTYNDLVESIHNSAMGLLRVRISTEIFWVLTISRLPYANATDS